MNIRVLLWLAIGLLAFVVAIPAYGDIPKVTNYQGVLEDANGNPISEPKDVVFAIWDSEVAGDSVWSVFRTITPDDAGRFSILLGEFVPIPEYVFDNPDRWLSIAVYGSSEMIPRTQIASIPYAYRSATADALSDESVIWIHEGTIIYPESNIDSVGIGTTKPLAKLDVNGTARMSSFELPTSASSGYLLTSDADGIGSWQPPPEFDMHSLDAEDGSPTDVVFVDDIGNVGVGTTDPSVKLEVNGTVKSDLLQIAGGSDLAEPFVVTGDYMPAAGLVVCISPDSMGYLVVSSSQYDRKVAGVISGAGGLNPGITMSQGETIDGCSYPVALSGRVYCWCDADYGAIEPGDLVTSSNTPGHAMKVRDFSRANGAILGKAMSRLPEGKGLVLVLVSLQ